MLNIFNKFTAIFDDNRKDVKKTLPLVKQINELEEQMQKLSDEELAAKTIFFKKELKSGKNLDDILVEVFAAVREAIKRWTGLRAYDVQLMGGILLHQGKITEMKTGEGKTLVAIFAIYLNALNGKGVHLVTVNDFLARRDAVWTGQVYSKLGLSVGIINSDNTTFLYDHNYREQEEEEKTDQDRDQKGFYKVFYEYLKPVEKRAEAYQADITYGTNSEFGFDYLRDNITLKKDDLRQRDLNFVIIDEVDSALIDEARVPLIISAPQMSDQNIYSKFTFIAKSFQEDIDFTKVEKSKSILITQKGIEKAEKALEVKNLYTRDGITSVNYLETALRAEYLFKAEKEYIIKDGEIIIVDEFTGRMQAGRRWSDGLHQAIESKEGVEIKQESRTYASVTYQNFFRMYQTLSGMTGTAETSKEEFFKVYNTDVVMVPTHQAVIREDKNDLIFGTEKGKFMAISKKIKELHKKGQPVLIGTASVDKSELLSQFLQKEKIQHTLLNAKNHEKEGEIIANAGKKGIVTIATNMAGRGVDIKLGGVETTAEKYQEIIKLGGLYVIGTERHESRRTDNQLRGRSGRQGDPGETQFYISLDDQLMRVFGNQDLLKKLMLKKMEMEDGEDTPISISIMSRNVEKAQDKIEGFNFDSRKHVLDYDDVLDIQRKAVYQKRKEILLADHKKINNIFEKEFSENKKIKERVIEQRKKMEDGNFEKFFKKLCLEVIDGIWMDHLNVMDHLKSSVSLQSYGQKDPLVEYKKESKQYFDNLFKEIKEKIADILERFEVNIVEQNLNQKSQMEQQSEKAIQASGQDEAGEQKKGKTVVKTSQQKIGRNEVCYCGSGKKYKKCHGKNQ